MRIFNTVISILLVISLIYAGFPAFSDQDVDRDGQVGLRDLVLSVQALAEDRAVLASGFPRAVSAFRTVALLDTVIQKDISDASVSTASGFYLPPLPPSHVAHRFTVAWINDTDSEFSSLLYSPPHRPPKA